MPIATSQRFLNASQADSNKPVAKVQFVLGDYCNAAAYGSTATSTGDDASGNYPASGAIDGDRTEINVGPASGADDDIGKSSWRSSGIPDHGDTVQLTTTFNQSRTINRFKIYHLSSHGLRSYKMEYWNGVSWIQFAATLDIGGIGKLFATTGTLDTVDFTELSTTKVRLTVTHTQVANDKANVVELEIYRLVDITDRVDSVKVSRHRDYKMINPMASEMVVSGINDDKFFSLNHVPTADELASGFINQELLPNIGIIVQYGFDYYGDNPEIVPAFVGTVDRIYLTPRSRDVNLEARDYMKGLINKIDSTKLKTGVDITQNIQYALNRANISNYEMDMDTTGINIDYFFVDNSDLLSVVRDLAQAAGDTIFYFDESGIAVFKDYSGSITVQKLFSSEADWNGGTKQNISNLDVYNDSIAVPTQFSPALADGGLTGDLQISGGNLTLESAENFHGSSFSGAGTIREVNALGLPTVRRAGQYYQIPRAGTIDSLTIGGYDADGAGITQFEIYAGSYAAGPTGASLYSAIVATDSATPVTVNPALHVAAGNYWVVITFPTSTLNNKINVVLATGTNIAKGNPNLGGGTWAILQAPVGGTGPAVESVGIISAFTFTYDVVTKSGTWTSPVYDSFSDALNLAPLVGHSGSYPGVATETTFLDGSADGVTFDVTYSTVKLNGSTTFAIAQRRYWRLRVSASTTDNINVPVIGPLTLLFGTSGSWFSPTIDTGALTLSYGVITNTLLANTGSVDYFTRSSPDGVSWDPWVAVSGGGSILSTLRRYIQIWARLNLGTVGTTPQILDITVSWVTGSGSVKYPSVSSFTFAFDSMLLDIQQEIADNLSGDTSILNDVIVQAQPLVLTGDDIDTQWQGTIGTPPSDISVPTPLVVTNGQVLTYSPVISGGMDISHMAGANPAAAAVIFAGGASGSWVFSRIHPTHPVLTITITGTGNITDLRIVGKVFSNADYWQAAEEIDDTSVAIYGDRQISISNQYIVSTSVAAAIASQIVSNFKDPVAYIPSCQVRPSWSAQVGDRVTITDDNLDLSAVYIIVGIDHELTCNVDNAQAQTQLVLLQVPEGL